MNSRQLQYVIAVAEEQSFSRAAEKLHISQPSLSQYIRNIEKELEIDIFDRTVTPLALTDIGREYVSTAREILGLESELKKKICDYKGDAAPRLNIAVSAYLNSGELSATLTEMRRRYPDVHVNVLEMFSVQMDEMLGRGELDFSISPIKQSYDMAHFSREVVSCDRFYLAVSRDLLAAWLPSVAARAKNGDVVDLSLFADFPFITMAERSLQTYSTNAAARKCGFVPQVVMRCRRWEMLTELVEGSVGAAFITDRFLLERSISDGLLLLRTEPEAPELVGAVSYRRGVYLPKAARAFIGSYKRIVSMQRDETAHLIQSVI